MLKEDNISLQYANFPDSKKCTKVNQQLLIPDVLSYTVFPVSTVTSVIEGMKQVACLKFILKW